MTKPKRYTIKPTRLSGAIDWTVAEVAMGTVGIGGVIHLAHYVIESLKTRGDIVEFGCYRGVTGAYLSRMSNRRVWLFDSFEGLPEQSVKDIGTRLPAGKFKTSITTVKANFARILARKPRIVKSWYNDLKPSQLPRRISFAHLDSDYYESVLQSLRLVYPKMSVGAYCLIHDYNCDFIHGVKLAVDEFMSDKPEKVVVLTDPHNSPSSYCMFQKQ
jgi:O-methyltransferase